MKKISLLLLSVLMLSFIQAQNPTDKAILKEKPDSYFNRVIVPDLQEFKRSQETDYTDNRVIIMDQSGYKLPNKVDLYKKQWAFPPISQGYTGTCWCYSTISFLESEVKRLHNKEIKLSEMFVVYWEYVEKARAYVRTRGESHFGEGSESNAVNRILDTFGIVPQIAYPGQPVDQPFPDHQQMFNEMKTYLNHIKASQAWNEAIVLSTIKSILNAYLGKPPVKFQFEGQEYSPGSFMDEMLEIQPDDFVDILSYKQEPYWQQVEYKVPDNWWHNADYYNVPLDIFMEILKNSIREGYTVTVGGDVSEPGFSRQTKCAMVPDFDIPSQYITEDARQFRFSNNTTTDDHGMHLIGYVTKNDKDWYLVKDSGSGSREGDPNAPEFGYYFFHEDYIKLKIMDFTVHKDAIKKYLKKFN